jgi:hypothetical protein
MQFNEFINQKLIAKQCSLDQLMQLLHVSEATMRRKLHGDSPFTIDEAYLLQQHFTFSIDALASHGNDNKITFNLTQFPLLKTPEATVSNYVQQLLTDFTSLGTMGTPHLYYAAKDLPLFYFFYNKTLASFKLYFWYMTLFDTAKPAKYNSNWLPPEAIDATAHLYQMYKHIPSTELWNTETINSTLDQIMYCHDSGLIEQKAAIEILQALHKLVDNLEENAANECKSEHASFTLYYNKILILDNSVLFKIGDTKLFYLPIRTLNFISSMEPAFTTEMDTWLHNQIKKSTLISGEAEKVRVQFVNNYKGRIDKTIKLIGA